MAIPLYNSTIVLTAGGATTVLLAAGNYVLEDIQLSLSTYFTAAAGYGGMQADVLSGVGSFYEMTFTTIGGAAGGVFAPVIPLYYRVFPSGLVLPRGNSISFQQSAGSNFSSGSVRINISGYSLP